MTKRKHIDDVQPSTVDEHFKLLVEDRTLLETEYQEVTKNDLPEWYDEKLFKAGQAYYLRNVLSVGVAEITGLLAILCVPDIHKVLICTKQSSNGCLAFKRYSQTLLLIYRLLYADVTDSNSMWYKALNAIRWKHAIGNRMSQRHGLAGIYQKDMAITQFGFIGYVLICPKILKMTDEPAGREAFNHFWRVTAYMLGISDRLNICRKSEAETTQLCRRIASEIIKVHMENPLTETVDLVANTLEGIWYIDFTVNSNAMLAFTYTITGAEYKKPLSLISRLNIIYHHVLFSSMSIPYFGTVARMCLNYIYMVSYWILENCPVVAWLVFGKQNTRLQLFPQLKY